MMERHTSTLDSVMAVFKHENREALMGTSGARTHEEPATEAEVLGEDSGISDQAPDQRSQAQRPTVAALVQRVLERQRSHPRDQ